MSPAQSKVAIGVIDVGSPKGGKLGWAVLAPGEEPRLGKDLDGFIREMAAAGALHPLAIGFEAPLFIPTPSEALKILSGRRGEGSRPWSAGAGAAVTAAALAVVTYTLAGLRRGLPTAVASVDFRRLPQRPGERVAGDGGVAVRTCCDVAAGEPLTICYGAKELVGWDVAKRRAYLEKHNGFFCRCVRCELEGAS